MYWKKTFSWSSSSSQLRTAANSRADSIRKIRKMYEMLILWLFADHVQIGLLGLGCLQSVGSVPREAFDRHYFHHLPSKCIHFCKVHSITQSSLWNTATEFHREPLETSSFNLYFLLTVKRSFQVLSNSSSNLAKLSHHLGKPLSEECTLSQQSSCCWCHSIHPCLA